MFTRYIADSNGYIKEISFGALIECGSDKCVEYTGEVPDGYDSLDAWFMAECERLHKWKIVSGNLTFDSTVTDPEEEWENPPMEFGVEYRTTKRFAGKAVYTKAIDFGALPDGTTAKVAHGCAYTKIVGINAVVVSTSGVVGPLPYIDTSYNVLARYNLNSSGEIAVNAKSSMKDYSATFVLYYTKD